MTVPMTLAQDGGASTCMRTSTVLTPYGVSLRTSTAELYVPGWLTTLASVRTHTTVMRPGASVRVVVFSDSHFESRSLPQSA